MPESMPEPITEIVGGEPYEYVPIGKHLVRATGVCGGRPTFKYTRVLVGGVLDRIEAGESIESVAKSYRGRVSTDAIIEAMETFLVFKE